MTAALDLAPLVIPLDGRGCNALDVGGKAAGLDRLASHHFPIPRSFAVTALAYRRFVEDGGLAAWVAELEGTRLPDPSELAAAVDDMERRFLEAPMPPEVETAIREAATPMIARGRVAVRSSATAEDLGIASFAGQYRTYVALDDLEGVLRAVRLCWASLSLPAVRAYRARHDIGGEGLAMGVVLQEMVEADWSGVAFTQDPGGVPGAIRIEVVAGLGEALVSGRITPDVFYVGREMLGIRSGSGRTPPEFLENLGRMLLRVEQDLDEPQDVEWAFVDGRLVLLQSRPITVSGPTAHLDDGFDGPAVTGDEFTPRGIVEMLPGVVPPLLWTINAPMVEHAFRSVVASLATHPGSIGRTFVGRFRGRAALNLSALRDLSAGMPGGTAAEVERQFLGRSISEADEVERGRAGMRAALRAQRVRRRVADEIALTVAAVDGIVALDIDLAGMPARQLIAFRDAVRDLAWRLYAAEVAASSAGVAAYQGLEQTLGRWLDPQEAALWVQRLTAGALAEDAVGVARTRELRAAYLRAVRDDSGIGSALMATPVARGRERISSLGPVGERFLADVDAIIRRQGSRSMYGGATWAEDDTWAWEQLALVASNPEPVAPAAGPQLADLMERLVDRRWRVLRVVTGQVVDLRRRWIQHQIEEATRFLALRERAKAALLSLGGIERGVIIEGARRLELSGHVAADAIELLSDHEFEVAVLGGPVPSEPDLYRRAVVRGRCLERPPLPETFVDRPDETAVAVVTPAAELAGWAASPGTVIGTARVVATLGEADRVEPGDIVVAPSTDPSWTPLLLVAGGLVLEEGGPLSHGAIVAREFGIPAVLNVHGATAAVTEGSRVEVDGFAGIVRILEADESADREEVPA